MKVKFFGGPWNRKKVDVPDTPNLRDTMVVMEPKYQPIRYDWHSLGPDRVDVVNVRKHQYYLCKVQGQCQTFAFYVHEDSTIDEILKKALT